MGINARQYLQWTNSASAAAIYQMRLNSMGATVLRYSKMQVGHKEVPRFAEDLIRLGTASGCLAVTHDRADHRKEFLKPEFPTAVELTTPDETRSSYRE